MGSFPESSSTSGDSNLEIHLKFEMPTGDHKLRL